jgi:hypothetical protein
MNEPLPVKFGTTVSPAEVAPPAGRSVPTDDEATAAMSRMGSVSLGQHELQDLATIGAYVQGLGVLRASRGRAMVDQQRLTAAIQALMTSIAELQAKPKRTRSDLSSIKQPTRSMAYLSAQLESSQRLLIEVEQLSSAGPKDFPDLRVPSFAAGQQVNPALGGTQGMAREEHLHADGQLRLSLSRRPTEGLGLVSRGNLGRNPSWVSHHNTVPGRGDE